MSVDDANYYNDRRVRASRGDGLDRDHEKMTLSWMRAIEDDARDLPEIIELGDTDEVEVTFPGKYIVCPTCNGRGKHVNPAIDCDGIGEDDEFWEDDRDEDGESAYFSGKYDVTCYGCAGRTTQLIIDEEACDQDALQAYLDERADEDEYERECYQERLMGC